VCTIGVQQCGTEGDGGDAGDHWKHWEAKVRNGVLDLTGVRECDKLHIRPVDSAERSGAGETACGGELRLGSRTAQAPVP
jgi:hypothetical protein